MKEDTQIKIGGEDHLCTRLMWNPKICEWVPFDLWEAYSIVNDMKEYVVVKVWQPIGRAITKNEGWCTIDSSDLNNQLKETESGSEFKAWKKNGKAIPTQIISKRDRRV